MTTGPDTGTQDAPATAFDAGTYEVLRDRLAAQATELARRAEALNVRRTEEFGSTRLELSGTERLRTEHTCVPRDIVSVGDVLLFGHNVFLGLKPETTVGDVFALYDRELNRLPDDAVPGLLDDPAFVREFAALHRYYRQAHLLQLRRVDGKVLAVFQTGEKAGDIRVLRWAVTADGRATFLDARGERDHVFPPSHDFEWTVTTREDHVLGRHPHVSIEGEVFVETVGGTLTVKVEDDTETGEGIHSEPVAEPLQSLADADIAYARVGALILLDVLPYKEDVHRYLVFNTLTRTVVRLDGIGQACRRLPEEQGIVFPGGYCLATGAYKTFDGIDTGGLEFERAVRSPNGEDVLFAFHARVEGRSLLLPYNMIRKEVAAPLSCHGWALFDDGTLMVLRADPAGIDAEPQRVHPLQLWHSPYVSDTYDAARPVGTGPLARVGNADLVRGISDCLSITGAVAETTPTSAVYEALAGACVRAADSYHWLREPELGDLHEPLTQVRATAEQVLAEFETVQALTRQAADALDEAAARIATVVRRLRGEVPRGAAAWVAGLTELRQAQGHLLTLKDMRYADAVRIDELAAASQADLVAFGQRAVAHLAREDAFAEHRADIERLATDTEAIATVAEAAPLAARIEDLTGQLRTVTEVVTGLDIGDATVRTSVLERIAEVLGGVNRARATLDGRRRELQEREGRAEFAAESALLGQAVNGAFAAADSPEACDEQLARLLVQVENLESRFAEFDDFLGELADRRDEIHETFSARKQTLADTRARRAERLTDSAHRVLKTITRRAATLADADAVATYFTSDPMPAKVRRVAAELRDLRDQVRAEELDGRLKSARQEALRALRDRTDLYADDGRTLRLGTHRFAVNTQPLDLTLVPHGEGLAFALTGTDYRSPVTDPDFAATRPFWDRSLPSESPEVYRAEHLAARLLDEHGPVALAEADDLPALVRQTAQTAYDEGYERGVHDHDATLLLTALLRLHESAGPLRHEPAARAAAHLFWAHDTTAEERDSWTRRAVSLARARDTFGLAPAIDDLVAELAQVIGTPAAATYLFEELTTGPAGFVISAGSRTLLDKFRRTVGTSAYDDDLAALADPAARRQLVEAWLTSYTTATGADTAPGDLAEAVAAELCPDLPRYESDAPLAATVEGLLGTHPRITGGTLPLQVDELLARTKEFRAHEVPAHRAYQRLRMALVAAERTRLRLDEYRPRIMSAFVRNRLIDEVYLPLVGDSLAKQLGTTGESKRTDTGGLLLLISPPGYGKTTLMEYVADRLGMILVKVNGPALGHAVTSLDPAEAPNATARQEVEKINFALEAGNNTLLYLDDIQHTSPELLQKFIPLCDATRRIEGVRDGEPRTYDLRGKRFAVCMAGNPYTESGSRFRIPDMLTNRADVWNLGDVLTGKEDTFALSFIENALTANPVLAPLAGRDRADLDRLIRLAQSDATARADRLTHTYEPDELERVLAVLRHLLTARATVLAVNAAYIASAAQADTTRVEPPFQLQGSYRNMNKIAQRVQPVMNDTELAALIDDHYTAEAQTLTTGAEANLLRLAELRGTLTPEQAARWTELKTAYVRAQALGGPEDDQLTRAVAALGLLADRIAAVESAINRAADPRHLIANPTTRHAARPAPGSEKE
ncbi:DNA repair ATPase [Streptomyces caniscabiei]|uniref:DNA repair ATPase n=2 Tax=Streptomyces caniscabiei TaxID=2746961 RepID=A0A927L5L0_9ACTN|nr:DNA repair ATPase [Streptomyces caniscabiei]MBD9725980.1 DNA repair ATPase [Streptomyces caniscabiei]MDX3507703.1 DNA repair ATPase [Streptomyces caniscabiei]MDX3717665.1 DNA repair ATPase [Streptomyces caniscabiei]WEO25414.1 DNA repair ATPase [Streptomyces caniscabiei]